MHNKRDKNGILTKYWEYFRYFSLKKKIVFLGTELFIYTTDCMMEYHGFSLSFLLGGVVSQHWSFITTSILNDLMSVYLLLFYRSVVVFYVVVSIHVVYDASMKSFQAIFVFLGDRLSFISNFFTHFIFKYCCSMLCRHPVSPLYDVLSRENIFKYFLSLALYTCHHFRNCHLN